jgi:hypothetical protein
VLISIWETSGHNTGFLAGAALDEALRWRAAKRGNLNDREREFIALSDRAGRSNRRQAVAIRVVSGAALAALIVSAAWFLYARTNVYQIRSILAANLEEAAFRSSPFFPVKA